MFCILTCEHASNHVPKQWAGLIHDKELLDSHAGYDIGAFAMARKLSRKLSVPLFPGKATRLLIDLNRSLGHKQVFSAFTKTLPIGQREQLISHYYRPYREAVCQAIDHAPRGQQVLHLSVHSFTPTWRGGKRNADIGLLYDPARQAEARFCAQLAGLLKQGLPDLRIQRNYPYRGTSDGFTVSLRHRYPMQRYLGIELEFNQTLLQSPAPAVRRLALTVAENITVLSD